jgi:hypothetical protein
LYRYIQFAVIQVNHGMNKRPDGSYELYMSNSAATNPALVTPKRRCMSLVIKDDVVYALGKNSGNSGCPATPKSADVADDGANMDLAALKADYAFVLRRPEGVAAEWPAGLPGMWKGKIFTGTPAGDIITPVYFAAVPGYAPNAWIYMDRDDPTVIATANTNVGWQSGVETLSDGGSVFFNTPYKWTDDASPDNSAGLSEWCNNYVFKNNANRTTSTRTHVYMYSANATATAGVSRGGLCPEAPEPGDFADSVSADEIARSGAYTTQGVALTKM